MNKDYKPSNFSFREHWKLHGYLSPTMIEELLDLVNDKDDEITQLERVVDDLEQELSECVSSLKGADDEAEYWRNKYESIT